MYGSAECRHDRRMSRTWSLVPIILVVATVVLGDERNPFDDGELEAALRDGEVMPLGAVLGQPALGPGQAIEVELKREDGRWVYEIEMLRPDGRIDHLDLDAATLVPRAERDRDDD
jgi:hypothetical protein